jgi:membrane protein DedA with SNARE-associated domain
MGGIVTTLLGLSGYPLIGVICGLIVLEELGIPMPMAPGDLMLVLTGVSIATGRVNPFVAVTAVYVSALLGAVSGREIAARIGGGALSRMARLLHARDRVEDLTAKIRRGGSTAVFLCRITPGVRLSTNQLSGLVAMPRRTFLMGLAPGIAVYEAVFISLGAWFGLSVLTTIKHHMPAPGELLLLLLIVVGSALAGRVLIKHLRGRTRPLDRRMLAAPMAPSSASSA